MRNYSYIYESAQLETFERQILSGHLTEAKLIEMYENNQLSEQQIQIAEGILGGLGNLARTAGSAIGNASSGVYNTARKGLKAGAEGAKAIKQNVSDIYQTGYQSGEADKRVAQLNNQIKILEQLFAKHIAASPYSSLKNVKLNDITLKQLKNDLNMKATMARGTAAAQRGQGTTGGVGSAMSQAYRRG
jgi:hypothetical protein